MSGDLEEDDIGDYNQAKKILSLGNDLEIIQLDQISPYSWEHALQIFFNISFNKLNQSDPVLYGSNQIDF